VVISPAGGGAMIRASAKKHMCPLPILIVCSYFPACWTDIHVHFTIFGVTLYVLSLHWCWGTVVHINQSTDTHLVL